MGRIALHDILCKILNEQSLNGEEHCYFEPPANISIKYPCIIYNYTNDLDDFADNIHYNSSKRYTITIIDSDPDSKIPSKLKALPYCTSDRNFSIDGLCHFVYTLFYNGPRIKEDNINENCND